MSGYGSDLTRICSLDWVVHGAEDEVVVTRAHRAFERVADTIVMIDHCFYVNHTLNSMQAMGVEPVLVVPAMMWL